MNLNQIKLVIASVCTAGLIASAAKEAINIHKEEQAKRKEIQKNRDLDIEAIRAASQRMNRKLSEGRYDDFNLVRILGDLDAEIEFEKIAIRNK